MSLSHQLARLRAALAAQPADTPLPGARPGQPACLLFFSAGRPGERAHVQLAAGDDFDAAWRSGAAALQRWRARLAEDPAWLRVDRVSRVEALSWAELRQRLEATKRNYFFQGIALAADFSIAMLAEELGANALLYDNQYPHCHPNPANLASYGKRRHGKPLAWPADDAAPVGCFDTVAVFADGPDTHVIERQGRHAGYRRLPDWGAGRVSAVVASGTDYLARQVRAGGRYDYGWFPCFDRPIPTYNALRHASSTYALLEGWEHTREAAHEQACRLALAYLVEDLIQDATLPDGTPAAFLVDQGDEIKLGGNAVCILALVKYTELTGDRRHVPLMERLARGILHMQDPATGRFVHVLNHPDLSVKAEQRIIYYDGEAAFGLMRLYGLTGDERWLQAVERAFEHFIQARHWEAHDHWLGYCVNELTRYRPLEKYYRFGLDNVRDHLDFVHTRLTTYPTLLELMMAAERMIARLQKDAALAHLLDGFDLDKFYRALAQRARNLMDGFFWPELAMFFKHPARIVGSFFIRHHSFRVRIDDVEHYLSGLAAYHRYLEAGAPQVPAGRGGPAEWRGWDADRLARVTGGQWTVAPPAGWQASGLVTSPLYHAPGRAWVRFPVSAGPAEAKRASQWARRPEAERPSAILCAEPGDYLASGLPVLTVPDAHQALMALGRHRRAAFRGAVLGITGSVGKTSVTALLAHALRACGEVGETQGNANLPHGIAWNLSCMPARAQTWVLEMAVGRMAANSALVRPAVAVVTGLAPAHLLYHQDLATLARRKSAIFGGMAPGGHAVLNRDMPCYDIFLAAALQAGLTVVSYGEHPEADLRLSGYALRADGSVSLEARWKKAAPAHEPGTARVTEGGSPSATLRPPALPEAAAPAAAGAGDSFRLDWPVSGRHMAVNALSVVAVARCLGLDAGPLLERLGHFTPVEGRGNRERLPWRGGGLDVIHDAYNANPASTRAALETLAELPVPARSKVLVLGDMLELGDDAQRYHLELADAVRATGARQLVLCGPLMQALAETLRSSDPPITGRGHGAETPAGSAPAVAWYPDIEALLAALPEYAGQWFQAGDVVLLKSSAGTQVARVLDWLKRPAAGG